MYESWFQLVQRPFGTAPDAKVYFPSNGIEAARSAMTRCIQRGGGPGLVIGATGVGKTTLALKLIDQFRAHVPVAYLSGRGIASRRELFQTVLFELGRPYGHDEGELRLELIDLLTSTDASRRRTMVVCDDADHFSNDLLLEIGALSNLATDGYWSTDVVLLGTLKLEESLGLPSLKSLADRVAARFYLHPLGFEETQAYLQFQLQHIGGGTHSVFRNDAIATILETSGGVPRVINQLCDHAMVLAVSNGVKHIDAEAVEAAWLDLQQLPPAERADLEDTPEDFIEFGSLDDCDETTLAVDESRGDSEDAGQDAERTQEGATTDAEAGTALYGVTAGDRLFPDESLETIERQVASIVDVQHLELDEDEGAQDSRAVSWLATNPFLESFDEEQVVLDLPLGMTPPRPAVEEPQRIVAREYEDDLLDEVLRQINALEERSLKLSNSLLTAQEQLEAARAEAAEAPIDVPPSLAEATCGGDISSGSPANDSELLYSYEVALQLGPDEVAAVQAKAHPQPLPTDNAPHVSEHAVVETIETAGEVQLESIEDVVPCSSVDRMSAELTEQGPAFEETTPGDVQIADTPQVTNAATTVAEAREIDPPTGKGGGESRQTQQATHQADPWPPRREGKRYRRLFANLSNR